MSAIHYQISAPNPNNHQFHVQLNFAAKPGKSYQLQLPAWLPGSYMIRDFAKNIIGLSAHNSKGDSLEINQLDKQNWQLIATDQQVSISYHVFAFDLSVRTAYLDSERGFFNGSSTFLAVKELADQPCRLTIIPVDNKQDWRVATGMPRNKGTEKFQFGDYCAESYDQLIDCPVAIGDFDVTEFTVEGVVHHLVFTSQHYGDTQRIAQDLTKLCQHHINLFGEVPFDEYWFITHLQASGFGGLEHKNSTILQASRFDLPNPNKTEELTEGYKTFLSLCSHEYFHAWNVCRIKPEEFVPYQLQTESYTEQLWAYEGITSYYDDFSLYRAGIVSFDDYLKLLSKTATRVYRGQGELKQSVKASSFNAWTKFYQQGPDAVNNIVSYYTKGSLIALWLDLTIRQKSNQQYSLDTLMRELWIHFGRPARGTCQDDFINIANILCQEDISNDFIACLEQAERLSLTELLQAFGVNFNAVKYKQLNSMETTDSQAYQAYLGVYYQTVPAGLKVTQVLADSPAERAGIAVNDIIIALANMKVSDKSLQNLVNYLPQGSTVNCHYFRDDQLLSEQLIITDSPLAGVELKVADQALAKNWQQIIG